MRKVTYNIPIGKYSPEEAKERIRELLKSYDPNYWLMKNRQQKLDKLKKQI